MAECCLAVACKCEDTGRSVLMKEIIKCSETVRYSVVLFTHGTGYGKIIRSELDSQYSFD